MNPGVEQTARPDRGAAKLEERLRRRLAGETRFDALSRTVYATDASIYEILPVGVVVPRNVDDVVAVLDECRRVGTSVIARGAGTGLAGGAVGSGVQLDLSRHFTRIGSVDQEARTVTVEAGVVLDELNRHVAPHGLQFAPDVATSSRATIGGMIANNSCGARSVVYGRTVDHVAELTAVLADGTVVTFGRGGTSPSSDADSTRRADEIETALGGIRDDYHEEIERRFPKILRSNGGYGLDRLGKPGDRAEAIGILCGSEGTLAVVTAAKLRLVPIPHHTALVVLHFRSVLEALGAAPATLGLKPSAVELVDRLVIDAGLDNPAIRRRCGFLRGRPDALLIVEFQSDRAEAVASRVAELQRLADTLDGCDAAVAAFDRDEQDAVWQLRRAGLGLLMSKAGDAQPIAFVEDSAVEPARLCDYIRRFSKIIEAEGTSAGYYAHASVGCIHVRPVINLKRAGDVERMRRIADAVSDLALAFGGAMTGEHGDGLVRSCWIEKMYGPRIVSAFKNVKRLFDPNNLLNPGKIVDPAPMTEHLRFGPAHRYQAVKTTLDFSDHGGMGGLAQMCSGVGECRQKLVGTMCPSFMATNDETHTTRARANALRAALSNRGLLSGLDDPHLADVMDLCIGCKACKTECPTGVDMARLKTEYRSHRVLAQGADRRARLIADMPARLDRASRFPRLANLIMQSGAFRAMIERRFALDRRIEPPRLATQTFRRWFRRHRRKTPRCPAPRGDVVLWVDTWTNHLVPQVGIAAVRLLEAAGFRVICPKTLCCGRPLISQGLLVEAKKLADMNVRLLHHHAARGTPIIGVEPSCVLTLCDEYPQLVRRRSAETVASQAVMIETFLNRLFDDEPEALSFSGRDTPLLYHAHCHQKAIVGSGDAVGLLERVFGSCASEINSGCCGMAGAFGHEVEHYDVARAIGEQRLFPAVRNRGAACIAVSGFSCRMQIEHHTGAAVRHLIEHVADALVATPAHP